jgi:hypothetical protein
VIVSLVGVLRDEADDHWALRCGTHYRRCLSSRPGPLLTEAPGA